jgi:eukaryotic-like serine/threonine-protein kinase
MQVIQIIDSGGFGIVHEVEDGGERYARKAFAPNPLISQDPDQLDKARRRFVREVRIQAQLNHPYIMPIIRTELLEDPPWFLMPLASENYSEQIARDRASGDINLEALTNILAGLEELHRLGYVHRDLKPKNVLRLGDKWVLSDFGLVLPTARDTSMITGRQSAWGTPEYAAPELVHDFRSAPPQADIFSFGCILHDIVGVQARIPFAKANAPGPLGAIIDRCTERDPNDRFPDIAALRSALINALISPPDLSTSAPQVSNWINLLTDSPSSMDEATWAEIIRHVERNFQEEATGVLLRTIDIPQLEALNAISSTLFARLMPSICKWIREGVFDYEYCDVLGARLLRIYELGDTREKAEAALAALIMACRHNRWLVMSHFMKMAGQTIDADLADRLAVEMFVMGTDAVNRITQIEYAIGASRNSLHFRVRDAINVIESQQN